MGFRPQRWPCPIVEAAYEFLKDCERVVELGGITV
jgi:hypothetical protein